MPPASLDSWTRAVQWDAAGDEAAQVLAGYLRVDTRNPPGNETVGARYLAELLRREGIDSEMVEFAPGRASLIARLSGSGEQKPICLLSHIDVASADPSEWDKGKGPLSGTIDEQGWIWGRGALDMKGMGALELMTMIWLKRLGVPLRRDVVLLAVSDEEVHNGGMQHLIKHHWDRIGCSHMVNEGGLGIRDAIFENHTAFAISSAEKGVLWLKLTVRGKGGHGSTPLPGQTPGRVIEVLNKLSRRQVKPNMHPVFEEFFARLGRQRGGVTSAVLERPLLVRNLLGGRLMKNPGTRAALTDTINITGISTGRHEPNVVSTKATITLDCRLLPGTQPEMIEAELGRLLDRDPAVSVERIFYAPALESPWDDPLFEALARRSVEGRTDAAAGPVLSVGFTDSIYARQKGVRAYGLIPFEVTQAEAEKMHAPKERVSVQNIHRGLKILFAAIVDVSADPNKASPHKQPLAPPKRPPLPDPMSPQTKDPADNHGQ